MAEDDRPSDQAPPAEITFQTVKRYETDEDHESRVRPAYVNRFDLIRIGLDVFLDACVMPVDDIAAAGETGTVEVIVLDRYVMNLETFSQLHGVVNELQRQLIDGKVLPINASFRIGTKK
jgi:hypothetical protein